MNINCLGLLYLPLKLERTISTIHPLGFGSTKHCILQAQLWRSVLCDIWYIKVHVLVCVYICVSVCVCIISIQFSLLEFEVIFYFTFFFFTFFISSQQVLLS